MGHISDDAYLGPGGVVAAAGGAGATTSSPAGPRQLEAVRRGAVRERRTEQKVGPSSWEHLEMALGDGPDRVSSLWLELGGTFTASVKEQVEDADGHAKCTVLSSAVGSWQQCRGGVELIFREAPELELPDLVVMYSLRRGSLIADALELPDGLAQEYSRCPDSAVSSAPLAGERLSLIERMLTDAAATTGEVVASPSGSRHATSPAHAVTSPARVCSGDSDDDFVEGTAPVGILEDGSDSDGDDTLGGLTPRQEHRDERTVEECKPRPQSKKLQAAGTGDDEEYADDFEDQSDDGSVAAD